MKGQILLIDDSALDLKIATAVLERDGYACHGFTDYKEALAWTEFNTPQIIFLDLQMPQVTGYQLIPIFKRFPATANTPIVIMSGKNQIEDVSKAVALGVSDYLVKPIDPMVLQEKVNKVTASPSQSEFASVRVPDGSLETVHLIRKLTILELSEFGMKIRSTAEVKPGETTQFGGAPTEQFGNETIFARCLSLDQLPNSKEFVMQFTFVGITESQRQAIRKTCRQLWIQAKNADKQETA